MLVRICHALSLLFIAVAAHGQQPGSSRPELPDLILQFSHVIDSKDIDSLEAFIQSNDEDKAKWCFLAGREHARRGDWQLARAAFDLGLAKGESGEYSAKIANEIEKLDMVLEKPQKDQRQAYLFACALENAYSFYKAKDLLHALEWSRIAITLDPVHYEPYLMAGAICLQIGEYEVSSIYLEKAMDYGPEDRLHDIFTLYSLSFDAASIQLVRGIQEAFKTGRHGTTAKLLLVLWRVYPEDMELYSAAAANLILARKLEEAEKTLELLEKVADPEVNRIVMKLKHHLTLQKKARALGDKISDRTRSLE